MKPLTWTVLVAVAVLVAGIVLGVAGIFLVPILGAIGVVVLIVWMLERKAKDRPPIE